MKDIAYLDAKARARPAGTDGSIEEYIGSGPGKVPGAVVIGCAYRGSGVARVFFVQNAGGGSKGFEAFRSRVDRDAETSYSPTNP